MKPFVLRRCFLFVFALSLLAPLAFAGGAAPSTENIVEVKFKEGQTIRLRDGLPRDISAGGKALKGLRAQTVLQRLQQDGVEWHRAFPGIRESFLDQLRTSRRSKRARRLGLPDMNLYYRAVCPPGVHRSELIARLLELDEVETAYPAPAPVPPPVPPDYTDPGNPSGEYQDYLDTAPTGIDARYAWITPNGDGTGVRICDVEYDWNEHHLDLPTVTLLGATNEDFGYGDSHGTAVMGELAGLHNGWGVRGMASGSTIYFAGAGTVGGGYNPAAAILTALGTLVAGDVILIEQQTSGPTGDYVPSEWRKSVYDAIVTAVGQGVIVVEAAGNGSMNLDDPIFSTGNGGHYPFLAENDSGAIIVGAGQPPGYAQPRARSFFSTYGSTVDVQG